MVRKPVQSKIFCHKKGTLVPCRSYGNTKIIYLSIYATYLYFSAIRGGGRHRGKWWGKKHIYLSGKTKDHEDECMCPFGKDHVSLRTFEGVFK